MNIVFLDAMTLGRCDLSIFEKLGSFKAYPHTSPEQCVQRAQPADIIITNKVVLDKAILEQLPNLKLICIAATGTNNVDLEYAKAANIPVKNVAGYSTASVAQHTMMLVLSLLGRTSYYDAYVKSGEYCKSPVFVNLEFDPVDIEGKNWGIIGMGSIGRSVAKLAQSFGANVHYYLRDGGKKYPAYTAQSLSELFKNSHIISIHAPFNEHTKGLIGAKEIALLPDNAVLVNAGRGGIIDEAALAKELQNRPIYAGLDVFEKEPITSNNPLLSKQIPQERLLFTPHIAWAYEQSKERLIQGILNNIKAFV